MALYYIEGKVWCRVRHSCDCPYCERECERRSMSVHEIVEAKSEHAAVDKIVADMMVYFGGDLLRDQAYRPDVKVDGLAVREVKEDERLRALGAPLLPGFGGV